MTESAFSPGHRRHFRLSNMLKEEGKYVMLSYLETYYCGSTLDNYLSRAQVKSKLSSLLKGSPKVLSRIQYDTLYPVIGNVDIKKLDLTILFVLIRALHTTVSPNDLVWTDPVAGNLSMEADITRIVKLRNRLDHAGESEITENEFVYEYQILDMILFRLLKNITEKMADRDNYVERISLEALSTNLTHKFSCNIDQKPNYIDVSVSTRDDPGYFNIEKKLGEARKIEAHEYSDISLKDVDTTVDRGSTLDKRHRDIGVCRDCRRRMPKTELSKVEFSNIPCPTFSRIVHQDFLPTNVSRNRDRFRNIRRLLPSIRNRYTRGASLHTTYHMDSASRCMLSGVAHLKNGVTVVTDTVHDSLQLFNAQNEIVEEIKCKNPRGVCAMSDDSVIVTLKYNSKIMIYRCDTRIRYANDVNITCDRWMYDVKYANGCAYVLCEKGELHIIDFEKDTDLRLSIPNSVQGPVEYFDMTPSGDKFFLSDGKGVVCMDDTGTELWRYRGGRRMQLSTNGVVLIKDKLLVASWQNNCLLKLNAVNGSLIREIGRDIVKNPLAVCHEGGLVFVTQYMSNLNEKLCREIVTIRY